MTDANNDDPTINDIRDITEEFGVKIFCRHPQCHRFTEYFTSTKKEI